MDQFNIFYKFFIELGLSDNLANISSSCALALCLVFAAALWVLLLVFIGYLIGLLIADKKYYLYFNKAHYYYTVGKSKFILNRICKKHLFEYNYSLCFHNKLDMFVFICQFGLLPIDKQRTKDSKGDLWIP